MAAMALFMVLLALALGAAWISSWPLLYLWGKVVRVAPGAARFNVLALGLPLLAGLVVAAGAVWPMDSLSLSRWACHCTPGETVHLCLAHPGGALPLLPGAVSLLIWFGWRPARVVSDVARRLLATKRLRQGAAWDLDPRQRVFIGALGTPNAFTAGLLRTEVLVDRHWWGSLSDMERRIVAAHEQAHARCRDPLTHTVGRLLAGLVPERHGRPLLEGWLAQAEQRADLEAIRVTGDALAVAELLLEQARRSAAPSLVPAFTGGRVETRIRTMLQAPARPPRLSSDLTFAVPLAAMALLTVGLFGFQIHSALERLLLLHP